jgi:hypothetical protein
VFPVVNLETATRCNVRQIGASLGFNVSRVLRAEVYRTKATVWQEAWIKVTNIPVFWGVSALQNGTFCHVSKDRSAFMSGSNDPRIGII